VTGVGWMDATGAVLFAVVAVVSAAQLAARWGDIDDRGGVALHAVMASGMAAMSLPGPGPLSDTTWVVAFAVAAAWALVTIGRRAWATWQRPAPSRSWTLTGGAAHHLLASAVMVVAFGVGHGSHEHGADAEPIAAVRSDSAAAAASASADSHRKHPGASPSEGAGDEHAGDEDRRDRARHADHTDAAQAAEAARAAAHAGHAGHEGHGAAEAEATPAGPERHESHGTDAAHPGHAGHVATTAGVQLSPAVDDAIRSAAGWPVVWQLAALAFVAYGTWSVRGGQEAPACRHCAARARPDDGASRARRLGRAAIGPGAARACAAVMGGGMAAMALLM
jgi:hypothetical protein